MVHNPHPYYHTKNYHLPCYKMKTCEDMWRHLSFMFPGFSLENIHDSYSLTSSVKTIIIHISWPLLSEHSSFYCKIDKELCSFIKFFSRDPMAFTALFCITPLPTDGHVSFFHNSLDRYWVSYWLHWPDAICHFFINVCIDIYVMMSCDLYGTCRCSHCLHGTRPIQSEISDPWPVTQASPITSQISDPQPVTASNSP